MFSIVAAVIVVGVLWIVFDRNSPKPQTSRGDAPPPPSTQGSSETPPSNLKVETTKEGTGQGAKAGDTISVHYTGTFTDGTVFDSSIPRGQPFSFKLGSGQVIRGWDLGLVGMKVGEKRKLTIPPELGYGPGGSGPIPPNSTLIFEVEMLKIN